MKEEERLKECLLRNEVPVIRQEKRNTLEQLVREEQQKIRLLPKVTIVKKFFCRQNIFHLGHGYCRFLP